MRVCSPTRYRTCGVAIVICSVHGLVWIALDVRRACFPRGSSHLGLVPLSSSTAVLAPLRSHLERLSGLWVSCGYGASPLAAAAGGLVAAAARGSSRGTRGSSRGSTRGLRGPCHERATHADVVSHAEPDGAPCSSQLHVVDVVSSGARMSSQTTYPRRQRPARSEAPSTDVTRESVQLQPRWHLETIINCIVGSRLASDECRCPSLAVSAAVPKTVWHLHLFSLPLT